MGRSVATVPDATAIAYQTFEPDEEFYLQMWREKPADERREIASSRADFEAWMHRAFEWDSEYEWDSVLRYISDRACELWPSFTDALEDSEWLGECQVVAKNAHSLIAVAEYCGMVSISLAPRYDRDTYWRDDNALGEHWRKQISARFEKEFSEFTKLGTFSDGTSLYTKIGA